MADDPAFLFYPGDYLRDTQCLSEKVQVAYDRIICEHMRNICISQQQLNFFIKRLNQEEKEELMQVLSKVDGGFQIKWVAESIQKRRKYSDSRRKNRSGEGKNSKQNSNNISQSYVPHMENEIVNEIEDEIINEYEKWSDSIISGNDYQFQALIINENFVITPEKFTSLVIDHLELICRYPKMRPSTQQAFRRSVLKHIRENKDRINIKPNGKQNSNQNHIDSLITGYAQRWGAKDSEGGASPGEQH